MFIVSGKSHCCTDTFSDVRFVSLIAKNIFKNTNYFMLLESTFAILCEIVIHLNLLLFSKSYATK